MVTLLSSSLYVLSTVAAAGPFTATVAGTARTYTDGGWDGLLHRAVLTNLPVGGRFWYRCCASKNDNDSGCGAASPAAASPADARVLSGRTVPAKGTLPITVAAIADLGENCYRPDGGCGNATIAALAKAAAAGDFAALVHAGDIAYTSGVQTIWDTYMNEMEPIASAVPYQVCPGNHEHYYNFSGYRSRFSMGAAGSSSSSSSSAFNNLYHSFDVGGVHFAAISTEHDFSASAAQIQWLSADLKKVDRSVTPWVVVFAHKPLYCSTNDYFDCKVNGPKKITPSVEPILAAAKVDLYLAGHLHNYERTYPVFNGTVVAKSYTDAKATVHAVVGMAGCDEGLTSKFESPSPDWSAVRASKLGYASLHFASATEMTFSYILSETGEAADSFTLTRVVPHD